MPLQATDYDQYFVRVEESELVADAMSRLHTQQGGDDWHIFVARQDNTFTVIPVSSLQKWLAWAGPNLFSMPMTAFLGSDPGDEPVDPARIGIGTAEDWAKQSEGGALVLVSNDRVIGRFVPQGTAQRGEVFPGDSMSRLYGDYINTARDLRAQWRPPHKVKCPECDSSDPFTYDWNSETLACAQCGYKLSIRKDLYDLSH